MTDRDAFEAAIAAAAWNDEMPRLVFADWLDEHGESDEATRQRQYVPSLRWMRAFACQHHTYARYRTRENYPEPEELWPEDTVQEYTRDFLEFLAMHREGTDRFVGFDVPYEFKSYSDEMWQHFEVLTGLTAPTGKYRKRQPAISCAC